MNASASVSLGPWTRGIQNVFDAARTPKECVLEADNVLIDSGGVVSPRAGYSLVAAGGHSLFRHNGKTYGVYNGQVAAFTDTGVSTFGLTVPGKLTWTVLNDEPVFTNPDVLGRISGETVKRIGVEEPGAFAFSGGSGTAVRVALSYVSTDGEEGPLSASVEVPTGATLYLPTPIEASVAKIRVYQSRELGDILYEVSEIPTGGTYTVTLPVNYGRPADNQYKSRMPGGHYVRYWRGRLLVARGRTLYYSEPMRYGMYDANSGQVLFEARIDFIEPVEGGVFVGLKGLGVRFLAGETPAKWEQRVADVIPAQPGTSLVIPTAQMKLDMQSRPDWVAVWLTNKGFALGLPTGTIFYPQADLLSGLPLGTGSLHFEGDRLVALSQ